MECDVVPFEGKVACQYGNSYSCVVGKGKAVIVEDVNEKMQALSILMKCQTGGDFTFNEELVSIVNVIRIDVSEFSAKRRPVPEGLKKQRYVDAYSEETIQNIVLEKYEEG